MIYIKLSENLVSYSKECSEFDNVLYTLDWDLNKLIQISRPWKVLGRHDEVFKPSIIQEFFEIWKFEEQPEEEVYYKFSPEIYEQMISTAKELESYGTISPKLSKLPDYELIYNCDILNLLEDYYGAEDLQKLQDFINLSPEELDIIRKFYGETTKEKKITLIQSSLSVISLDNISEYLPAWCKDSIKVFGIGREDGLKKSAFLLPEYKNSMPIGYTDKIEVRKEMIDEIYQVFEIGSVLRGSEIRTRFREIYQKYGLNPKASLIDFMEYFVIRKAKSEYEWYYRIIRRKKDEVMSELNTATA